jgi:hypothetical protein
MVAVIPVQEYERLIAEREARFAILDEIRRKYPRLTRNLGQILNLRTPWSSPRQ